MDSEPINVQKLLYIMRLASCLNQKLPIDFADEAKYQAGLILNSYGSVQGGWVTSIPLRPKRKYIRQV